MAVVVRPAVPAEHEAVGRITLDAYTANGYIVEDDFYAAHLLDATARAEDGELLVAELDGEVVGHGDVLPARARRSARSPGRARASSGCSRSLRPPGVVVPRRRWCGPASNGPASSATPRVVLSSLPVQVEAHRLYGRLGFRRTPEKDWSPAPGVDLIGFRLDL